MSIQKSQTTQSADFAHKKPRISLSLRAGFFVVLVCASLVAVESWQLWRTRSVQLRETAVASENLSKAMAQHAYDTVKEADTILVGLVERMENDGADGPKGSRLHALLAKRVSELRLLHGLFIFAADGAWIESSISAWPTPANNADREYFKYHRDHADLGPHIGPPILSKTTGDWVVTISRRINKPDGTFAGVALATVKMDYFREFYSSFNIGKSGAVFVASDKGIILLRRPFDTKYLGRDISALPLFRDYLPKAANATNTITSSLDGVTRVTSYRTLTQYPLVVSAALSEEEALAEWRSEAYVHGGAVALLVIGLGLMGFRLAKQIEGRARAESELRKARSSLETLNATLEKLAMQDGLTSLANRRQFDISLQNEFSRATREASSLALVMMDVDCFKQYNDIYGHVAGDECLRQIGKIVAAGKLRPGDVGARYGGEELALLLPGTNVAGAMVVAERIRKAVEALAINHSGSTTGVVTISAGVKSFVPKPAGENPIDLIQGADKALYMAKSKGRNQVSF